ncbi:uncharacterized protein ALTATR162_LOCUS1397 [Alternaria atra]|uniref:Uncharacterized protein n=1 Tax=Alternaria atra TaxID=119953 RepID=A0A8J2HT73_9PLEO|nr:uncharacterized protein ALTATR162_LOCUS1397 [Alternaria atra]CAG5143680.1 unnamed protein product [Alternaria atra]
MAEPLPYQPIFVPTTEPWRHPPAQYIRGHALLPNGWYQDNRKLRHPKTFKAFVWPKDGRNGSKLGRMKDILKGEGPDIFVGCAADARDFMAKRPSRSQWSKHVHLDEGPFKLAFNPTKFAPWTEGGILSDGRSRDMAYDFRTRKHVKWHAGMWSDAVWQPDPYTNRKWNIFPEALRTAHGGWWQDNQHRPHVLGGPFDNEFGAGVSLT